MVSWCAAEEPTGAIQPQILANGLTLVAPQPNSVVTVSRVWLIIKGADNQEPGELKLNGQSDTWNPRFVGNVRVADLWLDIGRQKLQIGDEEIRFVMGQNEVDHAGPKDWPVVRLHNMKPGPNPCMHCHACEKSEGKIRVGDLKTPKDACFQCHEVPKITEQHAHTRLEDNWLESCRNCHYLHASPHKFLLRESREGYLK